MKLFLCFLTVVSLTLNSYAQQDNRSVNLTIVGNKNLRITVDGRDQQLSNGTVTGNTSTGTVDRINNGQHTLVVSRLDLNTNRQSKVTSGFTLRRDYDMDITVNSNGSIELVESKKGAVYNDEPPMSNTAFSNLLRSVRAQRTTSQKVSVESDAFNITTNYFTTAQVEQLLRLIDQEAARLQLAKLAYSKITDPDNFYQLYALFTNEYSRTQLYDYVYNFDQGNDTGGGGGYAMSDGDFNTLYENLRQQWPPSNQVNAMADAFNNTSYYFTVNQTVKLIQLVNSESSRLRLAKLSYRAIVDRNNFYQVVNLLSFQSSKDELNAYVSSYRDDTGGGGGGNNNNNTYYAMSDFEYNRLYESVKAEWPPSTQVNMVKDAFNDRNNYFSAAQVSKMLRLFSFEADKLSLAKLSYRGIVDRNNINQVYDVLSFQMSKDELRNFINNYKDDNNNNNNTRNPMSDGNFNNLKQSIQQKYFPGEKYSTLQDVFNNSGYYFSSNQAKQLIELVSMESNRLSLAKLSYRSITDRGNFRIVYDLLFSQSSKTELDNYVRSYRE